MRRVKWVVGGLIGFFVAFAIAVSFGGDETADAAISESGTERLRLLCGAALAEEPLGPSDIDRLCGEATDGWVALAEQCEISEANLVGAIEAVVEGQDGGLMLARVLRSSGCPWVEMPGLERIGSSESPS